MALPSHLQPRSRGFTLAELMIAVAILGVLATLAMVSYRKYIDGARVSEPIATLQAIRIGQEQFRRETGRYLDASVSGAYFPMNDNFGKVRVPWSGVDAQAHADYARWRLLEVAADGPMRFGYKVNAGRAGQPIAVAVEYQPAPAWPASTDEWFVAQAKGDPDLNGAPTLFVASSFTQDLLYNEDQKP